MAACGSIHNSYYVHILCYYFRYMLYYPDRMWTLNNTSLVHVQQMQLMWPSVCKARCSSLNCLSVNNSWLVKKNYIYKYFKNIHFISLLTTLLIWYPENGKWLINRLICYCELSCFNRLLSPKPTQTYNCTYYTVMTTQAHYINTVQNYLLKAATCL